MALLIARRAVLTLVSAALVFAFLKWVVGAPWWLAAVVAVLAFPFLFFDRGGRDPDTWMPSSGSSSSSSE